jgi:enoyl-CoA hydratase
MPETLIGLWPDVGILHLLGRSPGQLGVHAALIGARLAAGDAITAGLADHFVPAASLDVLTDALRTGEVPPLGGHVAPAGGLSSASWIDECYAFDDAERILKSLAAHPDPAAQDAGRVLAGMAPTSVKVTLRAVRSAGSMSLRQVLDQDLRLAAHFLARPDVTEGIRAQLVDKDRSPRWQPARLADVTAAEVDAFFA